LGEKEAGGKEESSSFSIDGRLASVSTQIVSFWRGELGKGTIEKGE
jgi:hypothetical protein